MDAAPKRRRLNRPRGAGPVLLPTFFVGTAAIVVAVVALNAVNSDVGDALAFVLVVVVAGLLLVAITRLLGDQSPDDDPPGSAD